MWKYCWNNWRMNGMLMFLFDCTPYWHVVTIFHNGMMKHLHLWCWQDGGSSYTMSILTSERNDIQVAPCGVFETVQVNLTPGLPSSSTVESNEGLRYQSTHHITGIVLANNFCSILFCCCQKNMLKSSKTPRDNDPYNLRSTCTIMIQGGDEIHNC